MLFNVTAISFLYSGFFLFIELFTNVTISFSLGRTSDGLLLANDSIADLLCLRTVSLSYFFS